jgi:hypothetical protein
LLLNLLWAGGELSLGPVVVIELKDLVRAERSGVAQLFCFFCLEKDVIGICIFCGDTNVRFLAIPVASFILLTVPLGLYCSNFQLSITQVTI